MRGWTVWMIEHGKQLGKYSICLEGGWISFQSYEQFCEKFTEGEECKGMEEEKKKEKTVPYILLVSIGGSEEGSIFSSIVFLSLDSVIPASSCGLR